MNDNENQVTINETTEDPMTKAIAEAVAKGIEATKKKKKGGRPKSPRLDIPTLRGELTGRGIMVRFNLMNNKCEIVSATYEDMDSLVTNLHSELGGKYSNVTFDTLTHYTIHIAKEDKFNPFLDYVKGITWDGKDRLPELYDLMKLPQGDDLSRSLVHKWLLQTLCLQYNSFEYPFGAEGVLTYVGPQGAGKTALAEGLAGRKKFFLMSGQIKDNDKDFERRLVSVAVGELGELDATFRKSDIAKIKSFVTNEIDSYRLPYGRGDIDSPRHTSFIATVNDEDFLIDGTGNRRFWTIPFSTISYESIKAFDFDQLWGQIYATVEPMTIEEKAKCFRLTKEERATLDGRNSVHEVPLKGEMEVREILAKYPPENGYIQTYMLASDFIKAFPDDLKRHDARQTGKILRKMRVPSKDGGHKTTLYLLPTGDKEEIPKEWQK